MPSRRDVASVFDYQEGEFSLSLLCGDARLQEALQVLVARVTLQFGAVPPEPIYPVYNKPLMYATESSTQPMKEISQSDRVAVMLKMLATWGSTMEARK